MNFVSLIDPGDKQTLVEMEIIMKAFGSEILNDKTDIKELFDVQNIMEEGKVNDLTKCIHSILNYSFDSCTNNAVKIIDSSFVKFFHIAQLIIRFLLYCKSYLWRENMRLKIQSQEHDKLYRECHVRKLEARELKKELLRYQQSDGDDVDSPEVSECSQCHKVFVNHTFLYAHHKRRHSDQPFPNSKSNVEIQSLKHEINSLKSQMRKLSKRSEQDFKIDATNQHVISPVKMKVTNESSCLEAQEKYWRGKMKKMQDKFDEEMRKTKRLLEDLAIENKNLKEELASQPNISMCCVAVQTEISLAVDLCSLRASIEDHLPSTSKQVIPNPSFHLNIPRVEPVSNEFFRSKPMVFDSNVKSSLCTPSNYVSRSNEYENLRFFQNSPFNTNFSPDGHEYDELPPKKPDIIDEVDAFLENYEKLKVEIDARARIRSERRDNVGAVISKLFTETNGSRDSLAEKLIEIYKNQRSIHDQSTSVNFEDEHDLKNWQQSSTNTRESSFSSSSSDFEHKTNSIELVDTRLEAVELAENGPVSKTVEKLHSSHQKPKLQLIPFVRDIRSTIMKKYAKSRKTCSNIIENKITRKISTARPSKSIVQISNKTHNIENNPTVLTSQERVNDEGYSLFRLSNERQPLTSALKKSKSTGNIVKRVAFSDDLPTLRAASEIDLRKVPESASMKALSNHVDSMTVEIAPIDINLRIKPVPAPRSKKNINLCERPESHHFGSEFDRSLAEIEKNMK